MRVTDITPKNANSETKVRWAAYGRVSSKSAEQLHSFAAQIRYYKDYFKNRADCELVDLYMDEGISGTDMYKRDEFLRMIDDCKRGKIDKIITKSVSRFARNTEELLTVLRLMKGVGVSVYFEEQKIDTDKLNIEMIVTFPGMAAQKESETISGNLRWSYKKRMESGEYNCTRTPFGYKLVNGKLEINENESAIIQKIFNMYLQGMGIQQIADKLNEQKAEKRYGYKKWGKSTILYILNNERYMGDAVLQKKCTTETFPHKKVKNTGQKKKYYVENSNPPIISKEVFEKTKLLLNSKKIGNVVVKNFPLTGKIFCAECGGVYRRQQNKGNKAYWTCMRSASGVTHCKSRRVNEESMYNILINSFNTLKAYREEIVEKYMVETERIESAISDFESEIKSINKEIADLSARSHIITRLYTSGALSVIDYNKQTEDISAKIASLRSKRKVLTETKKSDTATRADRFNEILKETQFLSEFNEDIFDEILDSVKIDERNSITIRYGGWLSIKEKIM